MSKSAYELRMEMLQMAKDYMEQQYHSNWAFAKESFEKGLESGKVAMGEWEKYAPKFYSFEEVIKKAEELYKFVDNK